MLFFVGGRVSKLKKPVQCEFVDTVRTYDEMLTRVRMLGEHAESGVLDAS